MKPSKRSLAVELIVLLFVIFLKLADLQTGCVGATLDTLKRANPTTLNGDLAYGGLWDAYGGVNHPAPGGEALNRNASPGRDPHRVDAGLNLATAHYQLAASEFWAWMK